jgi:hypothetical protein
MQTVQEFYGKTYENADPARRAKLETAFRQYGMAERSENPSIMQRALDMAAKTEASAFA